MKIMKVLLLILLLFAHDLFAASSDSSLSNADQAMQQAVNGYPASNSSGAIDPNLLIGGGDISSITMDAITEINNYVFQKIRPKLLEWGMILFSVFVGAWFMFFGVKVWLFGGFGVIFGSLIDFSIKAIIPYSIITYGDQLNEWFLSGAFLTATTFMGVDAVATGDFPIGGLIVAPINNASIMFANGWRDVHVFFQSMSIFSIVDDIVYFFYALIIGAIEFFLAALYFFASILIVVQIIAAMIILPIALVMAPLLSPFIIGWIFSGIFSAWLSFLLLGFFVMIVGGIFAKIIALFPQLINFQNFPFVVIDTTINNHFPVTILWQNIFTVIIYSLVMLFLAKQVWAIASSLSGGHTVMSPLSLINHSSNKPQKDKK